ncbi:hypothetical protein FACS1894152_0480 [Bacilli bacterium]|nr:hypothetical protein FACS1894152_0320 [Bacilli bacterium]GHU26256.1 hypothetical protein FACS1894152_0480 [Bacilli bacterium]
MLNGEDEDIGTGGNENGKEEEANEYGDNGDDIPVPIPVPWGMADGCC